MPDETDPSSWLPWIQGIGFPGALVLIVVFAVGKFFKWLGPQATRLIDEAFDYLKVSGEAATKNAEILAASAKESISIQRENADTNKRFALALETLVPLVQKIDEIPFPPKPSKKR